MTEEILVISAAVMVEQEEIIERKRLLRELRDESDPFSIQESLFIQNYRLPKSLCRSLIAELEPTDPQKSNIPFTLRFLACLYFYANGSYQKCVGNYYHIAMSQSTVSRSLHHMSKHIVNMKSGEIRFPKSLDEIAEVKRGFYSAFGIKGTIGAIDCTHVGIVSPPSTDESTPLSLYMNRKGFYSINVEAVCDHRLLFTSMNAKFPGSCHDSGIWTTSPTRIHLIRNYNTQADTWLLGDQGYPLEPWLLTPVAEPFSSKEVKYNKLHAKSRNCIERAFGVYKSRFRCLSKHRILHYSHERASYIIYACAILHNILLRYGVAPDFGLDNLIVEEDLHDNREVSESSNCREGARVRGRYISSL